jgi:hypothetical protein
MSGNKETKTRGARSTTGFIACYNGRKIASAANLHELANRAKVKALLGKKGLLIKHNIPEDLIAVYKDTLSQD